MLLLEDDQQQVVDAIIEDDSGACLVVGDLGSGKTVIAVEAIKELTVKGDRVLIVCPLKNTLGFHRPGEAREYDGWIGTLRRQGYKGPITVITKREHAEDTTPGIYIIGREMAGAITRATKTRPTWNWKSVPEFAVVVWDECHRLQNRKSEAFRVAKTIPARYKIGLSGTPWGNSFDGAWAVTKWHWPDEIDNSFWRWVYTYAIQQDEVVYLPGGKTQKVKRVTGEQAPGAFVSDLPNYHRLIREYDVYYHSLYVELTPRQRKVYNAMLEDMFVWLDEHPLVAKLPLERRIRLREMSLAVPSVIPEGRFDTKSQELKDMVYFEDDAQSAKIEAVKEFLTDHDEPALLLTHSKKFAKIVVKRIPGTELIDGDTKEKDRDAIKARFLAGETKHIIATIPTIAEGMDGLQDICKLVVFFSREDSRILNEQVIGRIARRGQNSQVTVVDVQALDTFDTLTLEDQNEAGVEYLRSLRKEN